jgi:ubiquitin fusion degradation protein 1
MFGLNFFNDIPRPFRTQYRCYSVSMLPGNERADLEHGGKIIMPPSALDQLTRLLFSLFDQFINYSNLP